MSTTDRAEQFRRQVAGCQAKAAAARTEETRRAWLIAARGWQDMLEREESKSLNGPATSLIPGGVNADLETALKELAVRARQPVSANDKS